MTPKNTLQSWFTNGSKPTQEQFWAWQESYWHKSESIPLANIEGIDTALALKADSSMLNAKADVSAVYSKRSTDALLANKLDVPETEFALPKDLIAYGSPQTRGDERTEVVMRIPLSSITGQNVAYNHLITNEGAGIKLGANWEIDASGYYLLLKGLEDKTADSTFNKSLVLDENNRIAIGKGSGVTNNISVNVPQNINIVYPTTIANSNYVPSPTTPADIVNTFNLIKQLENGLNFTPFKENEILLQKLPQNKFPASVQASGWNFAEDAFSIKDGEVYAKSIQPPSGFSDLPYCSQQEANDMFFQIMMNKEMPSDKNWIVKFRQFNSGHLFGSYKGGVFGFVPSNSFFDFRADRDIYQIGYQGNTPVYNYFRFGGMNNTTVYFIKSGSKLSVLSLEVNNGKVEMYIFDYDSSFHKYFRFGNRFSEGWGGEPNSTEFLVKDLSYWIAP